MRLEPDELAQVERDPVRPPTVSQLPRQWPWNLGENLILRHPQNRLKTGKCDVPSHKKPALSGSSFPLPICPGKLLNTIDTLGLSQERLIVMRVLLFKKRNKDKNQSLRVIQKARVFKPWRRQGEKILRILGQRKIQEFLFYQGNLYHDVVIISSGSQSANPTKY